MRPDSASLAKLAQDIKDAELRWELFDSASPGDLLDAFTSAHDALVKAVENPKDANALAALVEQINLFTARAKAFANLTLALERL